MTLGQSYFIYPQKYLKNDRLRRIWISRSNDFSQ